MTRHLALLHTSPVHVETFDRLVREFDPAVRVDHVVDVTLLADARRLGAADPGVVRRVHAAMAAAAARGASLVVCTCSTIGGVAERTPPNSRFGVARIDRAMADRAVQLGPRILLVAALQSTLEPTRDLLRESAERLGREIAVETLCVEQAWPLFERGDTAGYLETIARAVRAAAGADVVVLAQASMAGALPLLEGLGVEVLASPALGIRTALQQLRGA